MEIEGLTFNSLSAKMLRKKSGIYKISINEHIYIGSSKSLYDRLAEHRTDLYHRRHSNEFLQRVCNKYGIENFNIDIVEFCPPEIRIEREKYWIDKLNADMNLQDPVSHTLSEESRKKLSNSIMEGKRNGRYKKKYDFAKIECYDYFGDYLCTFDTVEEAAEKCNLNVNEVKACLGAYKHGTGHKNFPRGKSTNGYRFRYSCSKVPPMKFEIREHEIGRYLDFYYVDENNQEQLAFSNVRDCWSFFAKHCKDNTIIIKPKLKSRESGKTISDGNPNPSAVEIQ